MFTMTDKKKIIVKNTKIITPKKKSLLDTTDIPKEFFGEQEIETIEDIEELDENMSYKDIQEIIFPEEFKDD